ncbi:hypothetical protein GTU79_19435 [Sodalis ligni]|uniref:hypothetical protein n=1 Tax=Sodalis ligni TaxID=2697027 RepID=UPI001BDEE3E3|nr:hypothetical protein [Sodalis ligni]QWA09516.1 hypothetical protein GTU79_19435 [Sodalis ligni]
MLQVDRNPLEAAPLSATLIVKDSRVDVSLFVKYMNTEWLFANKFTILSGSDKYQSSIVDFDRHVVAGYTIETYSPIKNDDLLNFLKNSLRIKK